MMNACQKPVRLAVFAAIFAISLSDVATPQQSPEADLPKTPDINEYPVMSASLSQEVAQMIALLGAQSYTDREKASDRLREIGPQAFGALRDTFFQTADLEVKLRIEAVVRDTYLDRVVYSRNGFLGISQERNPMLPAEYPLIPEGHVGVRIVRVHEDTAAARGGLISKDIVIAIDDVFIEHSPQPSQDFGQMIRQHAPDEVITLTVIREGQLLELPVQLGRCPEPMVKLGQIQAVTLQLDAARVGFRDWWKRNFRDPAVAESQIESTDNKGGSRNRPAS